MALSNYYYSNSTTLSEYVREIRREHERQQQRYLEEMARRQVAYVDRNLNSAFEGQRRAVHVQEPQKLKLNKVLLLCS